MKRRLLIAAIFLLAGAVVNVAVGLVCDHFADPPDLQSVQVADRDVALYKKYAQDDWLREPEEAFETRTLGYLERWCVGATPSDAYDIVKVRVGWPTHALGYEQWRDDSGWGSDRWGHLRLHPIWFAFAINTLFYAAIMWLPVHGLFALRRLIRARPRLLPRVRLLIVAVFLLIGAVVNVTVAWAFALRVAAPNPGMAMADREGLYITQRTGDQWWCQVIRSSPGYTMVVLEPAVVITSRTPTAYSGDVIVEMSEVTTVESELYHTWTLRRLRQWTQERGVDLSKVLAGDPAEKAKLTALPESGRINDLLSQFMEPPSGELIWIESEAVPRWARNPIQISPSGQIQSACGWPLASFWCEAALSSVLSGQTTRVFGGWQLSDAFQSLGPGRVLPHRLIASGFAVNTLFYAVVLWLLILGPFALRRIIRVRRGRCTACGYPTGQTDVCSECGKPLPGRAEAAT